MKILISFLIVIFASAVFAQDDLPEIGKLSDIRGKTKCYLVANGESRKVVLKALEKQKGFEVVDKSEKADFFIEYRLISRVAVLGGFGITETGELDVYVYRDKKKVIAWSESKSGGTPANLLIKMFLKAIERERSPSVSSLDPPTKPMLEEASAPASTIPPAGIRITPRSKS